MKELPERSQLTTEEKQQIKTLCADGWSVYRISRAVGRSPHTIKAFLSKPAVMTAVKDEKAELAELYRGKARKVVESISDTDISDASLQQKCVSTGILLDKSLLLAGELPSLDVHVLLDIAAIVRGDKLPRQQTRQLPPHDPPASQ